MNITFYFKHQLMASYDPRLAVLVENEGVHGYGAYWMIIEIISGTPNNCMKIKDLKPHCSRFHTKMNYVNRIIHDYGLFDIIEGDIIHPKTLNEQTLEYPNKSKSRSRSRKNMPTSDFEVNLEALPSNTKSLKINKKAGNIIDSNNNINNIKREEEEEKIEKEKKTSSMSSSNNYNFAPIRPKRSLADQLEELKQPGEWHDLACLESGNEKLLRKYFDAAVEEFRKHLVLYCRQEDVEANQDAKGYFMNFVRQGSITSARLMQELEKLEEKYKRDHPDPYRFEKRLGNVRTYMGCPIPDDAPPRPNEWSMWVDSQHRWIDTRHPKK